MMEPKSLKQASPNHSTAVNLKHLNYRFVGDQEIGIACVYRHRNIEYVIAHIRDRRFRRLQPAGWRNDQHGHLSLIQTRAGYFALVAGLIGPP